MPVRQAVTLNTADGAADALLFRPSGEGAWPAVILWPDLTGLRPVYADLGRRLAAEGYVVLVPNAFYRSVKLDGSEATAQPVLPFGELFRRGAPWRAAASDEAIIKDSFAYVAFLDALNQVDKSKPVGTVGINIGAAHAFVAARAVPTRIAAVAAIHPMAIATTRDNSPHLFVDQSKAAYLVEIAQPDDEREPNDKDDLRAAFAAAGLPATVEVVPAAGGFMVADDPGYDEVAAQRVWGKVLALFRKRLD
jgi:carboxymethylenebutenolidase